MSQKAHCCSCGCKAPAGVSQVATEAGGLLSQCDVLLGSLSDPIYQAESGFIRGGSIGKHIRHTLDHYAAILAGLDGRTPIDYDHRERGVPVESDRHAAQAQIRRISDALASLNDDAMRQSVEIRVMLNAAGDEARLGSTLGREIAFATHHGVHHVAMMKAIAGEFGVCFSDDLGKAPSTLNYERSRGATATA